MDRKAKKDNKLSGREKSGAKSSGKVLAAGKDPKGKRPVVALKGAKPSAAAAKKVVESKAAKAPAARDGQKPKPPAAGKEPPKTRDPRAKEPAKVPPLAKGKVPPAKDAAEPKAPPKRKRKSTEVRLKAFWGVFNQMLKRVAVFEYSDRKGADKKAAELGGAGKQPHFVQLVKEIIRDE